MDLKSSLEAKQKHDHGDPSLQVAPLHISKIGKPPAGQPLKHSKRSSAHVTTLSILFGFKQDPSFPIGDTQGSITNLLRLYSQSREQFPKDSIEETIRVCAKLREWIIHGNMFWVGFTPLQIGEQWQVHRAFGLIWTMCTVFGLVNSSKIVNLWSQVEWMDKELNPSDQEIRYVIQVWISLRYVLWKHVMWGRVWDAQWIEKLHEIMSCGLPAICSAITESEKHRPDAELKALHQYKKCPGFEKDSFLISACWGFQERRLYKQVISRDTSGNVLQVPSSVFRFPDPI